MTSETTNDAALLSFGLKYLGGSGGKARKIKRTGAKPPKKGWVGGAHHPHPIAPPPETQYTNIKQCSGDTAWTSQAARSDQRTRPS